MSNLYTGPGQGARLTQVALWKQIWIHSNKRSFLSGMHLREYLDTALFANCFAHVLAKGQNQYPYFKYLASNIILLTPGEHALLDQGTEESRISYELDVPSADWSKVYKLRDELKKLYKKKFPSTRHNILQYRYSPEEIMAVVGYLNKKYFDALKR